MTNLAARAQTLLDLHAPEILVLANVGRCVGPRGRRKRRHGRWPLDRRQVRVRGREPIPLHLHLDMGEDMVERIGSALELPVTVDFEAGYHGSFTRFYAPPAWTPRCCSSPRSGSCPGPTSSSSPPSTRCNANSPRAGSYCATAPTAASTGYPGTEGAFLACSLWVADALHGIGRHDEVVALFKRLLGLRSDHGYSPGSGSPSPSARSAIPPRCSATSD